MRSAVCRNTLTCGAASAAARMQGPHMTATMLCVHRCASVIPTGEGTIGDTRSGYVRDPTYAPQQMRSYQKLSPKSMEQVEVALSDRQLQRNELEYPGYTTPEIQLCKQAALRVGTSSEELTKISTRLHVILDEFCDSASGDSGLISRTDCHHLRYILSLCYRRLKNLPRAEELLWEVVQDEPWSVDAVEGLLEIIVAADSTMQSKLKPLLDFLTERGRVDIAYTLLADFILTAAAEYFTEHGEGATSTYIMKLMAPIARSVGRDHAGNIIEFLYNCFDEVHFSTKFAKAADREFMQALVIAFLKTLVARDLCKLTPDPVAFEFHVLHKLNMGLRSLKRRQEAYGISEKIIRLYRRSNQRATATSTSSTSDSIASGSPLDADIYRISLFEYVHDRALDAPVVAKQLCIEAIEEFPDSAVPWKLLSVVLHREGEVENAIVAAKKSLSLDSNDLSALLLLANLFEATNRPKLSEEVLERYRLLVILAEQNASAEDQQSILDDALSLEGQVKEVDVVAEQFAELQTHFDRYHAAHLYTKDVTTEPAEDWSGNLRVDRDPKLNTQMPEYWNSRKVAMPPPPPSPAVDNQEQGANSSAGGQAQQKD